MLPVLSNTRVHERARARVHGPFAARRHIRAFPPSQAPAPPNVPLIVRSSVVEIKEGSQPGVGKVGGGCLRVHGPLHMCRLHLHAMQLIINIRRDVCMRRHTLDTIVTRHASPRLTTSLVTSLCRPRQASVEVDVSVLQAAPEGGGAEQLLASATGIFKKLGALRAL